jgi:protein-disulfide isomerase
MSFTARRLAVLGALLGAFASAYLLIDYVWGSGICLTGSGCDTVRLSAYAYPFGIPMPLLGLGFYTVALLLAGLQLARLRASTQASLLAAWSVIGLAVMAVLTVIEVALIHALCGWCLLSAVASLVLAAGSAAAWRDTRRNEAGMAVRSGRRARRARDHRLEEGRALHRFTIVSSGVAAVAFGALLIAPVLAEQPMQPGQPLQPGQPADVPTTERPQLGNGATPVVVFSDFQCPACAAAAPALRQAAESGAVTLTYRFFPLTGLHANARAAALAAIAANAQGRFWQYHDALFARQPEWAPLPPEGADATFAAIAASVGLDMDRWRTDIGSAEATAVLDADLQAADELGLRGTPSIFIDGVPYRGAYDPAAILAAAKN